MLANKFASIYIKFNIMLDLTILITCKEEYEKVYSIIDFFDDLVDEFVIVITGQRKSFLYKESNNKINIVKHEWNDNFSDPLNVGIKKCSKKWIFRIDADEEIDSKNLERLIKAIHFGNDNDLYGFEASLRNYIPKEHIDIDAKNVEFYKGFDRAIDVNSIRLFRNHEDIFYDSNIGGDIYDSINKTSFKWIKSNILIHHWGYLEIESKADYYIKLYEKKIKKNPKDSKNYYQVGKMYEIKKEYEKACKIYKEGHDNCQSDDCLLCYLLLSKKIRQEN